MKKRCGANRCGNRTKRTVAIRWSVKLRISSMTPFPCARSSGGRVPAESQKVRVSTRAIAEASCPVESAFTFGRICT